MTRACLAAATMLAAFGLSAGCSSRSPEPDAGPPVATEPVLPEGEWSIVVDTPERGEAPAFALVVGAGRGSYRWTGRSLVPGMRESHTGSFVPTGSDLLAVWREVDASGFFDSRDGTRDPDGRCQSVSYRGPDRATARCIDGSPDADRLRRIVRTVEVVVRRHAEDFDRPTPVPTRADRCEEDGDCVLAAPVLHCCAGCPAPMTKKLRAWHAALARRCEDPVCAREPCAELSASARCDPHSKVCVAVH